MMRHRRTRHRPPAAPRRRGPDRWRAEQLPCRHAKLCRWRSWSAGLRWRPGLALLDHARIAFSRTTARMMITSAHSFSLASIPVAALTAAAASKITSMGSFSWAKIVAKSRFFSFLQLVGTILFQALAACADVSPPTSVSSRRRTSSFDWVSFFHLLRSFSCRVCRKRMEHFCVETYTSRKSIWQGSLRMTGKSIARLQGNPEGCGVAATQTKPTKEGSMGNIIRLGGEK